MNSYITVISKCILMDGDDLFCNLVTDFRLAMNVFFQTVISLHGWCFLCTF